MASKLKKQAKAVEKVRKQSDLEHKSELIGKSDNIFFSNSPVDVVNQVRANNENSYQIMPLLSPVEIKTRTKLNPFDSDSDEDEKTKQNESSNDSKELRACLGLINQNFNQPTANQP